jgi:uncharacterized protein YbjT (DUF2867 family)
MANILVTGASGYIGGRLVPALLDARHEVRCLARTPPKLSGMEWRDRVEVTKGDVTDAASLEQAMDGIEVAFYLIHSMGESDSFAEVDRKAAAGFREAAEPGSPGSCTWAVWGPTPTRSSRRTCGAATRWVVYSPTVPRR